MRNLELEATASTPQVYFSVGSNTQIIKGVSTPIDSVEFYAPLIQWVNARREEIPSGTAFEFELSYFNSSSMKALLWLLQQLEELIMEGKPWTIKWIVVGEDEFMEEAAEAMQALLEVNLIVERR
jgi:hypothetical protein